MSNQIKKYYSLNEAQEVLRHKANMDLSFRDIRDLCLNGDLTPCFYHDGGLIRLIKQSYAIAHNTDLSRMKPNMEGYIHVENVSFRGYFAPKIFSCFELFDDYDDKSRIEIKPNQPVRIIEVYESSNDVRCESITGWRKSYSDDYFLSIDTTVVYGDQYFNLNKMQFALEEVNLLVSNSIAQQIDNPALLKKESKSELGDVAEFSTMRAVGIMALILASEVGRFRKGENNAPNAKAIGDAVATKAQNYFLEDEVSFKSFNKKISKALELLDKK